MTVEHRPGRIQSINADQEVILKQVYAYFFKYFGYELDIPNEDLPYKDCYVSSTRTTELSESGYADLNYGLVRTGSRTSVTSSTMSHKTSATSYSTIAKKKKGLFKKGGKEAEKTDTLAAPPESSRRMKHVLTQSSKEQYIAPNIDPKMAFVYTSYYKQNFENSDDYMSDNEDTGGADDAASIDTFVTASSDSFEPDISAFVSQSAKNVSSYETQPCAVKPNASLIPGSSKYDHRALHNVMFSAGRNDAFDNFVLRFVRARKFQTEACLAFMLKSMEWRSSGTFKPDEWVQEGDAPAYLKGDSPGFIRNFTSQKSYVRGVDKNRNPLFFFKAKKHLISESPLADTQRFAVFTIESCRFFLRDMTDSVDTCSIVFDLTGFSLKNADYNAIKFLAEVFEAHYPECLGSILIFNAPWIFSTVWNVIKNWLDPVVASKIHFTKDFKELNKFVDKKWIPDYMGGDDTYDGAYPVPTAKDGHLMKKRDGEFVRLKKERDILFMKFFTVTKRWIESTSPEISDKYLQDKIDLDYEIAQNYIKLDPYLRYPGFYDRNGSLKELRC